MFITSNNPCSSGAISYSVFCKVALIVECNGFYSMWLSLIISKTAVWLSWCDVDKSKIIILYKMGELNTPHLKVWRFGHTLKCSNISDFAFWKHYWCEAVEWSASDAAEVEKGGCVLVILSCHTASLIHCSDQLS